MADINDIDPSGFETYQGIARSTAIYPGAGEGKVEGLMYATLGLVGEAGEIANKVKKIYRDGMGEITPDDALRLRAELGDVLWYVSAVASELGISLGNVAVHNSEKLLDRKDRGVLGGSGDNR